MSTPHPTPPQPASRAAAWRPHRRALWWVLGAFALGLVAFALVIRGRDDGDFFRADTVPPTSAERRYDPLPAPLPAGEGTGLRRIEQPAEAPTEDIAEARPLPPPPPPPRPVERPRPAPAPVARRDPEPLPGRTPAPDYPARALMRGEGGTALVIVHIGPDGVPTATELAQSSGSRDLDRAAQSAVRRWRFEPAMADGRPTVGRVVVPVDFRVDR